MLFTGMRYISSPTIPNHCPRSQGLARIPDLRGEEFKETVGGALADDGDKLIHLSDFLSRAFSSFFRSRCNFSMSFGVESATFLEAFGRRRVISGQGADPVLPATAVQPFPAQSRLCGKRSSIPFGI